MSVGSGTTPVSTTGPGPPTVEVGVAAPEGVAASGTGMAAVLTLKGDESVPMADQPIVVLVPAAAADAVAVEPNDWRDTARETASMSLRRVRYCALVWRFIFPTHSARLMNWATSVQEMKTRAARRYRLYAAHVKFGFAMLSTMPKYVCASVPAHQSLVWDQ